MSSRAAWRRNRRPVYGRAELKRLIEPETVAIVGLSRSETSFGARTRRNLQHCETIRLYGVNPGAAEVHGVPCVPTIAELPERTDCAIIAVPQESVETLVEQCAERGFGACIIYASGYAETGLPEKVRLQERLAEIGRAANMRIVGPNCIGVINNLTRAGLIFVATYATLPWRPGGVGLVSQSGGLGHAMTQAVERGGSFSHFFAAGNSCDVDVCDYVSYLADEPRCRAIVCAAEGLKDGDRLLEAAEKAFAAEKPIVMYKFATAAAAAEAAMSHTGTLAGSNAAYEAAFRLGSIIEAKNFEDLYETASFLAKAGKPLASGVAAVTASGGASVITLDRAEQAGVAMPKPSEATRAILTAAIPEFGSPSNPCDVTAQVAGNPESYGACAEALLCDPAYGALVVMSPTITAASTPKQAAMFSGVAERTGKPVCISWLSEWLQGPASDIYEQDPRVALFHTTERCYRALAGWIRWGADIAQRTPMELSPTDPAILEATAARLAASGPALTEREAKEILAGYDVPVALDRVVQDAAAAIRAAEEIGYPVVLKVESPDIPHKTEAGVVRLGLSGAVAVGEAYHAIMTAAARLDPKPEIRGVLVQPMVPEGVEMVVGARLDPTFGPLVVVGLGGIMVELLRDSVAELAPIDEATALAMLARLKGAKLLDGFRGSAAIDRGELARIVAAVSRLAADFSGDIAEIDVNPVICSPGGAVAVDALIVRRPRNS